MTQGQKNGENYLRARACIRLTTRFSPARSDGPYFRFFRYKIGFVWSWLRFLCHFVCLYTFFFFRGNFVTFFLDPGLSEVCKCSKTPIGSFKIKVS